MRTERGTVRRHVRIARSPADVWAMVGDPDRITEWFPGIEGVAVDGDTRVVTTGAGLPMPEDIVTVDPIQRRFQYRIAAPMFREHLSTLDVIDLEDGTCLVVYGVDTTPATLSLVIGGAAGNALGHLKTMMESS
jgi:uncharacterized protein YndB with AHSA1/START domain